MRIIYINGKTLVVLQEVPGSEWMASSYNRLVGGASNSVEVLVCDREGEIVLYTKKDGYSQIDELERVDQLIVASDPSRKWRNEEFRDCQNRFFKSARAIMNVHMRNRRIDDLLRKEDDSAYLWA